MTSSLETLDNAGTGAARGGSAAKRGGERLSRFTPRARKVRGGRGHSVLVGILKLLLPLLAVVLIGLVIMWPTIEEQVEAGPGPDTPEYQASGEAQIINPRFTGLDDEGRPFEIEGDLAYQDINDPELIDLDNLRGTITLSEGETARVESQFGHFDRSKGRVELRGDVVVSHDQGAVFRTEEIMVDINANEVWGDQPVEAVSDEATVNATGFEVQDGGATIVFRGPARMVVDRSGAEAPATDN